MLTKMKRQLSDAVEMVPAAKHRRVAADAPAETFLALLGNARGYIYAGCVSKLAKKTSSHSMPLSKRPNSCSGPSLRQVSIRLFRSSPSMAVGWSALVAWRLPTPRTSQVLPTSPSTPAGRM